MRRWGVLKLSRNLLKNAAIMIFFFILFCLEIVYRSNWPICLVAHICQSGLEFENFTHKHKDYFYQIWKKKVHRRQCEEFSLVVDNKILFLAISIS